MKTAPCPGCQSSRTSLHSPPHPTRSVLSDGTVFDRPLRRASCADCGLGFLAEPLNEEALRSLYAADYTVLRPEGETPVGRAQRVAELLRAAWGDRHPPDSVLELGCGSGALLSALAERWPRAELRGLEPAPRLAALAEEAGHTVDRGGLELLDPQARFDLVCSVNVLEHLPAPAEALARIAASLTPEGRYAQITPDGDEPGLELLFFDHSSSFSSASLERLAQRAGLTVLSSRALDGPLREFRLTVFAAGSSQSERTPEPTLGPRREAFLRQVANTSLPSSWTSYYLFGAGELSEILDAYCPELLERSAGFVVDDPSSDTHRGRPLLATSALPPGSKLLLAVHPRSVDTVLAKLRGLGHNAARLDWGSSTHE